MADNKIFIGNLPFASTTEDVKQWICTIVPETSITGISIIHRATRSLGYGFAEFSTPDTAQNVVMHLKGTSRGGRIITAEITHPRPPQALSQPPPQPKPQPKPRKRNRRKANKTVPLNPNLPLPPQNNQKNVQLSTRPTQQPTPAARSKTMIFVTNLPFTITEEELHAVFSSYMIISVSLATKENGRKKGYGFVEFAHERDAQNAILLYNGFELSGRKMEIKPALITEKNPQLVPAPQQRHIVQASNLPKQMDESQLVQYFQELSISSCWVSRHPETGASLQEGYVEFRDSGDAKKAVKILQDFSSGPNARPIVGKILEIGSANFPNPQSPNPGNSHAGRSRPKHRNWRGRILHGKPPHCAYQDFVYPLGPYYLPPEFEEIVYRREEVVGVQVDQELKALIQNRTGSSSQIWGSPLRKTQHSNLFHDLVHTEETRMRVDIRQYDLSGVTMKYERGLYVIPVPGLAEKRPSVLRGDIVKVKLHGDTHDVVIHDGYAYFVNLDNVHVSFHQDIYPYVAQGEKFDVQFTFNRTPIRLYHRSLNVCHDLWQKLACPAKPTRPRLPVSSFFGKVLLNPEQGQAVVTILHNKEAPIVLHGPPGTGKTSTLVEAILQIVHRSPSSRILVCAPSNTATDLVASLVLPFLGKATMLRLNALMRGPKTVEPEILLNYCYMNKGSFDIPPLDQLLQFNIILSTCVSSGYLTSMGVPRGHFTHIFVDEAGEALEPETLIPLFIANASTSIVLAGDHLQLGPIVRSSAALEWKYDRSLMERLLSVFQDRCVCKLVRSYRAHLALMNLYNSLFYNGQLINCSDPKEACSLLKWKELPNPSFPLMFIHSESEEKRDEDSPSWYNYEEKEIVMGLVKRLLDDRSLNLVADDIGIITPYRKQVQKINQLGHFLGAPYNGCKVGTVESFQGEERKVIILSLVRSREVNLAHDSKFKLGFCDNPKRLNVAISRAKDLLIVVGNAKLFGSNDPYWNALLTHFKQNNLFKGPVPSWNYRTKQSLGVNPSIVLSDTNADLGWDADVK